MTANQLPVHIQVRLKAALADVEKLARDKRLEDAFAYELLAARDAVHEATRTANTASAEQALHDVRTLWALLRGTPAQADPDH